MATTMNARRDDKIDYDIICPICKDEFKDPVIIECHHSFCRHCIGALITRSTHFGQFNCPSCKTTNRIPLNGVAGFTKSFYIEQLKDAKAKLKSPYPICSEHTTEDLRFYCTKCETPMCRDCKVLKHEGHTVESVALAAKDMREKLREYINKIDVDLNRLRQAKEACKADKKKVIELKKSARNMIENQVQEMKDTINNVAGMLDQNVCSYFQNYEDEIDVETSVADLKSDDLQRFKTSVVQEIKFGSDHSVIGKYNQFLENRGQIVVADRKPSNPDYKTKLAKVYCKGSINATDLQSMVGTVAETSNL